MDDVFDTMAPSFCLDTCQNLQDSHLSNLFNLGKRWDKNRCFLSLIFSGTNDLGQICPIFCPFFCPWDKAGTLYWSSLFPHTRCIEHFMTCNILIKVTFLYSTSAIWCLHVWKRHPTQFGTKSTDAEEPPAAINNPAWCLKTPKSPWGYKHTCMMSTDAEEPMRL